MSKKYGEINFYFYRPEDKNMFDFVKREFFPTKTNSQILKKALDLQNQWQFFIASQLPGKSDKEIIDIFFDILQNR